ncbi:bifunctional methylenetetrahydrofolate dehydrogenase/methenyltetrahydrofolate cyclohydrolase FolD [Rhizobium sp. BK060]|uniref:bifunctional 5,10-methylenetetrahydrofolate dehydrogenase/5,10-methenyltetrahydrofolate cyclohydrolase n=1 Tax=Rhizobium sp. BK060 TaxID=2587096 RepID=UPI0016117261|nr:bifunctional methylenetetrahydrofolate dehydrogenase/methenyltetrahydrofolate cyclohydrolase FolD [Rhizobium sp. BK060]MBB3396054.1 methylenetetrahydrofolate dehydrogenase (NADP+)/methenyltetrahydrofolate cyclohydrolase [Rhizobium sp. BK060]
MSMDRFARAASIDGKQFAAGLLERIKKDVEILKAQTGVVPGLAVVLVGDDPASSVYVASKHRQTVAAGMKSFVHQLPAETSQNELLGLVHRLNVAPEVHGILVQLPLPVHLDPNAVIQAIHQDKDVDGFHVSNAGRLFTGNPVLVPCTPLGCMMLLKDTLGENLSGLHAVVVGKSNIVGKPMAQMLMNAHCTVTVVHSQTRDTAELCRAADILVVAAGRPGLVRGDWIKPGAVVIDVGINRIQDGGKSKIVGDVAFGEAGHARAITPVPGGVGPMTIACLLSNTLTAFRGQHNLAIAA